MPLQVVLAGHNLDRDLLLELRALLEKVRDATAPHSLRAEIEEVLARDNWTPETLAAAYARVSRDPQSVTELRAAARAEVDRARRSAESIVFGLGHSSVAEHAVFNFDVLGVSRLAVEFLERQRLASYTEKSQRYILLDEDWVLPAEIRGTEVEPLYRSTLEAQHRFYREAYAKLLPYVEGQHPDLAAAKKNRRLLEGMAKEDARYGLSLATTVQLGETINARNLEALIARCRAHPLREVRELGDAFFTATASIAPSLIKYTEPTPYRREGRASLVRAVEALLAEDALHGATGPISVDQGPPDEARPEGRSHPAADSTPEAGVRLVGTGPDPDGELIATLLFAGGAGDMEACRAIRDGLDAEQRRSLVLSHLRHLGPHDAVLREYEHLDLVFELILSASCFAQLKRHRMATLTPLPYAPELGVTIPDAFAATGLLEPFRDLMAATEEAYGRIREIVPEAAAYVLTNAHRRRVLMKLNAREMHHLSRLREDAHAQWDIRRLAARMVSLARERMPLALLLAAGKDRFEARRGELFPGTAETGPTEI